MIGGKVYCAPSHGQLTNHVPIATKKRLPCRIFKTPSGVIAYGQVISFNTAR